MKQNMGAIDRIIRIIIAAAIAMAYFTGTIGGVLAIVLGAIAAIFVITSLVGMCPIYSLLGISSRPHRSQQL